MPSPAHEVPLQLLRDQPSLLASLLEKLAGHAPEGALEPIDPTLRFADPAEVRPDLLFAAERPRWILLELQNRIDPDKGRRWLLAAALQVDRTGEMGEVVVLTSSRRVAAWARTVGRVEGAFGSRLSLTPLVLLITGEAIDALLDEAHPELAFFAAWAVRGRSSAKARAVVERAVELTDHLPEVLRDAAARAIVSILSAPLLDYLKAITMNPEKLPETRAARRFREYFEGRGRAEGLAEGEAKGLAEGEAKGLIHGKREALIAVLGARGLAVSVAQRAAIAACNDAAVLDGWIVRAATAGSVAEVLRRAARSRQSRQSRSGARRGSPAKPRGR